MFPILLLAKLISDIRLELGVWQALYVPHQSGENHLANKEIDQCVNVRIASSLKVAAGPALVLYVLVPRYY